jgi:two-component system, chemotaxis family, chemotaxis protein CheY
VNILIVDDSRAMRMIVKRVLGQTGYADSTFLEASDGAEALALIKAGKPDLVLSDWNMPEMTGIELLHALRAERIAVRFGFVTSECTPDMREQAIAGGALFLIAKPFTAASFEDVLSSVVAG